MHALAMYGIQKISNKAVYTDITVTQTDLHLQILVLL